MNSVRQNNLRLIKGFIHYQVAIDLGIRKLEFVAKTQFHSPKNQIS